MLAHQGGWDESIFVAVPIVVFFALLLWAKRRAEAESGSDDGRATDGGATDAEPAPGSGSLPPPDGDADR